MAERPRRAVRCKAMCLACWNVDGVPGRMPNWSIFSASTLSIFVSYLKLVKLSSLPIMAATAQTSHPGPPLFSPQLSARSGPNVRSVLPDCHVISSRHVDSGGSGWIENHCSLQPLCQRHTTTLTPRRDTTLRARLYRHIHFPQAEAVRQLPGAVPH